MKHIVFVLCLCLIVSSCGTEGPATIPGADLVPITFPSEFLEDCTIQNVDISARAIFDETIGINESIKPSLAVNESNQNRAILGFEHQIMKIDQVWIPECMERMKMLTIQGIEKTIEGLKLYYAGEVADAIPAFREGSSLITNGSWHIAMLHMCLQTGFNDNCYQLMRR